MNKEKITKAIKKIPLFPILFAILLIFSVCFMIFKENNNVQSSNANPPKVVFVGDYKVGDGDWVEYDNDKHIPIKKSEDVTLKGHFLLIDPSSKEMYPVSKGFMIAFYLNHINVKISDNSGNSIQLFCEVEQAGESSCGETWQYYRMNTEAYEDITIVVSNPHIYGNPNAVDDMLDSLFLYYNTNFEMMIIEGDSIERFFSFFIIFWGIIIILVSLFSYLLRIKKNKNILPIGFTILFAGIYFYYCLWSVSIHSDSILLNTIIVELAGMFFYLFLTKTMGDLLCEKKKIFANLATINSSIVIPTTIILTLVTDLYFFDMWLIWSIFQGISFILLFIGIGYNIKNFNAVKKIEFSILVISFVTYVLDTIFSAVGGFEETGFSRLSFIVIFMISIITLLRFVPKNVNNALKAKELEKEKMLLNNKLQESRIQLMISQIQPHFLYNMLNTIYHLCDKDIDLAKKAVDDFSSYLRNNINSLSTTELVTFDKELEHINTYIELEKIRFGNELEIEFDIQASNFKLPILSIQPLVENAIKHGVSKKRGGGKVIISSYENETEYIITINDNGVGYDINKVIDDDKKHIGIDNVRNRLENRVNGKLIIESEIGVGTKSTVYIPKKEIL